MWTAESGFRLYSDLVSLSCILFYVKSINQFLVISISGLVILVSGWSTFHTLFSVLLHTILIRTCSKSKVHWINFVSGFLHLFFFRLCGSGNKWLPWFYFPSPPSHTNAIQMIMTLKLMGLAFEVHETHQTELEKKHKAILPNIQDIFHYAFAHSGILTGNQ